jgi:outer membrane lipoprotein-sorting protein
MRKFLALPCVLVLALGFVPRAQAQEDESRALIAKAIKAQGGEEKLSSLKAMQAKGKGTINIMEMNLPFTAELFIHLPDKLKVVVNSEFMNMNVEIIQVYDGKKGWAKFAGMLKDFDADELKEARKGMYVEYVSSLVVLKDKAFKLSLLGESKVEGRDAVGVRVSREGEQDVNLYFDKKEHLLLKSESRGRDPNMQEVNQEKIFLDYKEFDGIRAATRFIVNHDGKRFLEMDVTEQRHLPSLDASIFVQP